MAINIILQSDEENAQDIDDAHGVVLFYIYIRNTNNGAIKSRFSNVPDSRPQFPTKYRPLY